MNTTSATATAFVYSPVISAQNSPTTISPITSPKAINTISTPESSRMLAAFKIRGSSTLTGKVTRSSPEKSYSLFNTKTNNYIWQRYDAATACANYDASRVYYEHVQTSHEDRNNKLLKETKFIGLCIPVDMGIVLNTDNFWTSDGEGCITAASLVDGCDPRYKHNRKSITKQHTDATSSYYSLKNSSAVSNIGTEDTLGADWSESKDLDPVLTSNVDDDCCLYTGKGETQ